MQAVVLREFGSPENLRAEAVPDPNVAAAEEELQAALGTKVRIDGSKFRGSIRISFHSERERNELFKRLLKSSKT